MTNQSPGLSPLFHALADPMRRAVLSRLAAGPARVTDLARPAGPSLSRVPRHLAALADASLIATATDGRTRTCAFVPAALEAVRTWLDAKRAVREPRLDRLKTFVTSMKKEHAR
jgi:DNA-binding transcriptional ArsR family regulator